MIPIPDGYVRREAAAARLGIGIQTFDNQRRQSPDFPKPDYLGRTPLWKVTELDEWRAKHPARKKPDTPAE